MTKLAPALDYPLDRIVQVRTYREDLGDIDALAASIQEHGLISPLVITVDGMLISGARRLAAIRRLGWREAPVYVAAHVTDQLRVRLAMAQDLIHTKQLGIVEATDLYEELRAVLEEERELSRDRLQEKTGKRLGDEELCESPGSFGALRRIAARAITDTDSSQRFDRANHIRKVAANDRIPDHVRQVAREALDEIKETNLVNGPYHRVRHAEAAEHLRRLLASATVDDETAATARRLQHALALADDPAQAQGVITSALKLKAAADQGGGIDEAWKAKEAIRLRYFLTSVIKGCEAQSVTGLATQLTDADAEAAHAAAAGLSGLAADIEEEIAIPDGPLSTA